ncbi:MAG TPA: phospholipase A [Noviherbaspirillum sp.]
MRTSRVLPWALLCAAPLALAQVPASPAAGHTTLADCAALEQAEARLQCYDRLAAEHGIPSPSHPEPGATPSPAAPLVEAAPAPAVTRLESHWELVPASKRGLFRLRPHLPIYLMASYTSDPNNEPYRPFEALAPEAVDLARLELAFQLSFKLKFAQAPMGAPVDLWFGYTQRSFWQASNEDASSPFRATDYRPELMAVFPLDRNLFGLRLRFLNLGLVHESNGQASTLSRSWNRVYAQAGFERGDFTLLGRVWKRFNEDAAEDDNPDIIDYLGRGDVTASYRREGHEYSLSTRHNFSTGKGALQLGWSFPLSERARRLKGYVQLFSGYGNSLIDYDHRQDVLGVGLVISD